MRVPFLLLAPACVLLGFGTAVGEGGRVGLYSALLALVGGVTAHISVNALNEYVDCLSGLDSHTQRTPFSGGSGVLPRQPAMAPVALITGLVALAITVVIGVWFAIQRGPAILPLGLAGVLVIVAYTPWLTRQPLLCLVAPGLGFGTLMVMGTHFVLTGHYSWTSFIVSLVPFFLVGIGMHFDLGAFSKPSTMALAGVILLAAVGLITFDTLWQGLLPPAWYLLLHLLEANLITPVLLGRRFTINPVVIFVSLIFWTWLWGVPGALLSVPILVSIKVVCDRVPAMSPVSELFSR